MNVDQLKQILAQTEEMRKRRALQIAADNMIRRNGAADGFDVYSQTSNACYNLRFGAEQQYCPCADSEAREAGQPCKHIASVAIFLLAEQAAKDLAAKHGITMEELESKLLSDLCQPHPNDRGDRLCTLLYATRRLIRQQEELPHVLEIIIQYHTSGVARNPHIGNGKVLEVIEDGQSREPRTTNLNRIIAWLIHSEYKITGRQWIDPPGLTRRQKLSYAR